MSEILCRIPISGGRVCQGFPHREEGSEAHPYLRHKLPALIIHGIEEGAVSAGSGMHQPRVLVAGSEGCGQDHLAPALVHALEGLPVHSIGLPALLSDASARSGRPFAARICYVAGNTGPLLETVLMLWSVVATADCAAGVCIPQR